MLGSWVRAPNGSRKREVNEASLFVWYLFLPLSRGSQRGSDQPQNLPLLRPPLTPPARLCRLLPKGRKNSGGEVITKSAGRRQATVIKTFFSTITKTQTKTKQKIYEKIEFKHGACSAIGSICTGLMPKREASLTSLFRDPFGARTQDPNIKSVVLYRLS